MFERPEVEIGGVLEIVYYATVEHARTAKCHLTHPRVCIKACMRTWL